MSEWGASSCWEGKGGLGDRGPQRQPQGRRGDGSRWQRGAMDAAATHLPTAHLHNPRAEVSNEDTRGLIGECF